MSAVKSNIFENITRNAVENFSENYLIPGAKRDQEQSNTSDVRFQCCDRAKIRFIYFHYFIFIPKNIETRFESLTCNRCHAEFLNVATVFNRSTLIDRAFTTAAVVDGRPMAGVSFRKSISRSAHETCTRIVVPLLAITVLHQPIQPAEISSLSLPLLFLSLSLFLRRFLRCLAKSSLSPGLSRSLVAKLNSPGRAERRGCAHFACSCCTRRNFIPARAHPVPGNCAREAT